MKTMVEVKFREVNSKDQVVLKVKEVEVAKLPKFIEKLEQKSNFCGMEAISQEYQSY